MFQYVRSHLILLGLTVGLCSVAYPLAILAVGQWLVPTSANGSLVVRDDGTIVGSRLVAQEFKGNAYFHPRPSAAGYNAAASSGSNFGANNPKLRQRVEVQLQQEYPAGGQIPADAVTASGSGLDPHISLRTAREQLQRVASSRGRRVVEVEALLDELAFTPLGGAAGERLVNVLEVNLELDRRIPVRGSP
ncbi:MAG TPA: potassium-transporting ATPase subunit KdpC [Fimbriiglobus sp.]|jgi:K+-transporting ATPase ATPase C chain|nr:potassium-transporting ATPase subunit KdpC [Fimbriiglobus sp.]